MNDESPPTPDPAGGPADHATRGEMIRHRLLLAWGFLLVAAIIVGTVGFLVRFFLLQF